MEVEGREPAPRWRQTAAGLIDMAVLGGVWTFVRRRGWLPEGPASARLLAASGDLLREQATTPGQRLLGLRTVDRRTGRRMALWRTLTVAGATAAGQALVRGLEPPHDAEAARRRREEFERELREIDERHGDEPGVRAEEIRRAFLEHHPAPTRVSLLRTVGPSIAVGILSRRLRRRLAPTTEVLDRGGGPHSP